MTAGPVDLTVKFLSPVEVMHVTLFALTVNNKIS